MQKKKILLTGASGTVGIEVFNLIWNRKHNYDITLLLRNSKKNRKKFRRFESKINIVWGDLVNYDDVKKAVDENEIILHVAAVLPDIAIINPDVTRSVNVGGTEHILKAIVDQKIKPKIIYTSSVALYGDRRKNPIIHISDPVQNLDNNVYTETKIKAEDLIKNSGLEHLIFRVAYVVSTDVIRFRPLMFYMPLDTLVEAVHAKDVATALVNAIERDDLWGNTFNLGGGKECQIMYKDNLNDFFEIMGFGRNFLPDSAFTRENFHCGFYDLAESKKLNDLLHFQNHNLEYFYGEVRKWIGFKRFLIPLVRPILRNFILRRSKFYKKSNIEEKS
ncbi:MAG: NAD-dependent epimerase/dehydratase family protein, partial [Candidatus Hermodarchaeota archaeon]